MAGGVGAILLLLGLATAGCSSDNSPCGQQKADCGTLKTSYLGDGTMGGNSTGGSPPPHGSGTMPEGMPDLGTAATGGAPVDNPSALPGLQNNPGMGAPGTGLPGTGTNDTGGGLGTGGTDTGIPNP
jgi:hypothetical protein